MKGIRLLFPIAGLPSDGERRALQVESGIDLPPGFVDGSQVPEGNRLTPAISRAAPMVEREAVMLEGAIEIAELSVSDAQD